MLTTTIIASDPARSPFAKMLLHAPIAPAVGSEPPTRHGTKPRPSEWEQMCDRVHEIEEPKTRKTPFLNFRPFSRLSFMEGVVEAYDGSDGYFLPHTNEVEDSSTVGIDPNDEAGLWLADYERIKGELLKCKTDDEVLTIILEQINPRISDNLGEALLPEVLGAFENVAETLKQARLNKAAA